jgi:hypothetical protein
MDLPIIDQTSAAKVALKTSHLRHGWSRALEQGEAFGSLFLSNLFGREKGSGVPEPIPLPLIQF